MLYINGSVTEPLSKYKLMYKEKIGWTMVKIEHIFWGLLIWPRLGRNAEIRGSLIIVFFLYKTKKIERIRKNDKYLNIE